MKKLFLKIFLLAILITILVISSYMNSNFRKMIKTESNSDISLSLSIDEDEAISVAEFTKLLMINGKVEISDNTDHAYMDKAKDLGIIQGGEFIDPNSEITRAEMSRMISRSLNLEDCSDVVIKDSIGLGLYGLDICKSVKAGIVTLYDDKSFRPFTAVSKSEATAVLERVHLYLDAKPFNPLITNIPNYNEDGLWTDEWFLKNIQDEQTLYAVTNIGATFGNYYFKDEKLVISNGKFLDAQYVTIEDESQNKRLFKLIKLFVQKAYETNRYVNVNHIQKAVNSELSNVIRIEFAPRNKVNEELYFAIDFPIYPKDYMAARYKSDLDKWQLQDAGLIWRTVIMYDQRSFPATFDDLDEKKQQEILISHDYIMSPYKELMHKTGEIIYGSKDESRAIIDYMIDERVKDIETKGYENYSQIEISGYKIHNDNWSKSIPYFITEIK